MKMRMTRKMLAGVLAAAVAATAPMLASGQESQVFKGTILSHEGDRLVVRTPQGDQPVNLNPDTKIEGTQGAGVLRRDRRPATDLIRGLPVEIVATKPGQELLASQVTFKTSDLKTARQIEAGLYSTEGQVAANKQAIAEQEERLNNIGNLVAAGRTKVFFNVGSYAISDEGKQELQAIATQAKGIKSGYRLAVVGRADPSGNAAANRRLSAARAAAVKAYLQESCGVLPGNFVPATALGESTVAEDPDPPKDATEARRVTVTIMVSKGSEPG